MASKWTRPKRPRKIWLLPGITAKEGRYGEIASVQIDEERWGELTRFRVPVTTQAMAPIGVVILYVPVELWRGPWVRELLEEGAMSRKTKACVTCIGHVGEINGGGIPEGQEYVALTLIWART